MEAAQRADSAYGQGDMFNFDLWTRIAGAVAKLLLERPPGEVEAEVNYDEFTAYCRATGKRPDPMVLLEFAAHRPLGEA